MADPMIPWMLAGLFLILATLYSSVGMGGGSGYLAAMALLGMAPENLRLTALILNIVVSSIGLWKFVHAGHFDRRFCFPFVVASVPMAFLGGAFSLPSHVFKPLMAVVLLWAATLLLWRPPSPEKVKGGGPPLSISLGVGGGVGLLSGLIGIGGGIFIAPLVILKGWATPKQTAALSSFFILTNSVAALAGVFSHTRTVPSMLPVWLVAVGVGGWVGSEFGAKRLSPGVLKRILAAILIMVSLKTFLVG